jgi:hypothetical protein
MRKSILALVLVLVFFLVSSTVNATNLNVNKNLFNSTSESDGTIAIGCTVYNEDGTVYGTEPGDGKYLENIVPQSILSMSEESKKNILNPSNIIIQKAAKTNVKYKPSNKNLAIRWKNLSKINNTYVDVNIINSETGKVIARGYNLNADENYITANNVQQIPLEIEVLSKSDETSMELCLSSTDNNLNVGEDSVKSTLQSNLMTTSSPMIASSPMIVVYPPTRYITGAVPKNIDGNQGTILINHIVKGDSGSRVPHSKYISGTNNMTSVNMALVYAGIPVSYVLNLGIGHEVDWNITVGVGDSVSLKMSTNSNSGNATVDMGDLLY